MKTIQFLVFTCLLLISFACEKELISEIEVDQHHALETSTKSQNFLEIGDPEEAGNDAIINPTPPQTDFLFDYNLDTIVLVGQKKINLFDDEAFNPLFDLMGRSESLEWFEPLNANRKVAGSSILIENMEAINSDSSLITTALQFDFGHGTLYANATFLSQTVPGIDSIDQQWQLKQMDLIKSTRLLDGQLSKFNMLGLEGTLSALDVNQYLIKYRLIFKIADDLE